jgi:hypothetical protein
VSISMRLRVLLLGATLLTTFGCAATEPRQTKSDMSGRPYVLAMGRCLAAARQSTVRVRTDRDDVIDRGVVVGSTGRTIRLRRPDRLAIQLVHPRGRRQISYDGSRLVCLEVNRNSYASVPARGRVENMFASLRQDNHYVRPLAALCDPDPGLSLCAKARRVTHLGKRNLSGRPCNLVRVERADAVLDRWISDSTQPLLPHTAVRQTNAPEPERLSRFENWNLQAPIGDAEFKPRLPAGAYQIELYDVTGMP